MSRASIQQLAVLFLIALLHSNFRCQAGLATFDFDQDPLQSRSYVQLPGSQARWIPDGGVSGQKGDGYLALLRAAPDQTNTVILADFDRGVIVGFFTLEMSLRIGGGTGARAEGFSINLVRFGDPLLEGEHVFSGTDQRPAPSSLAEEGSMTGLSIGFDTQESGTIKGALDIVGISVRVDGELLAQFPVPLLPRNVYLPGQPKPGEQGNLYTYNERPYRDLASDDPNYAASLETGTFNSSDDLNGDGEVDERDRQTPQPEFDDPNYDLWAKNLRWANLKVALGDFGQLFLFWKGQELTPPGGIQTVFFPSTIRIVLAGSTRSDAWQAVHVDQMKIFTIPPDDIGPPVIGTYDGFRFEIRDTMLAIVDPTSFQVELDSVPVTPAITKTGSLTQLVYKHPVFFPSDSTHSVRILFRMTTGDFRVYVRQFRVPPYVTIPPDLEVSGELKFTRFDRLTNGLYLEWFGYGALQESIDLRQWSDVSADPIGSFLVTTNEPRRFFRLRSR